MSESSQPVALVWTYCIGCKRDTKHDIIFSIHREVDPEISGAPITILEEFQIVACRGCESHSFRSGWKPDDDETNWFWDTFPQKVTGRKTAFQTMFLPRSVRNLYSETLKAYNVGAEVLAAAGLRATVEAVCVDRGFTKGDLKTKIDALCAAGVLPKDNALYLHQHRFLGNEAVHDMASAPDDEFLLALEILEHLIQSLYDIPRRAKQLVTLRTERGAQTQ